MKKSNRRQFIKVVGRGTLAGWLAAKVDLTGATRASAAAHAIYVAKNGSPVENVGAAIELAGGIGRFVGQSDVVVLKPNGQWSRQGYTHTLGMKALIDLILARPGGFDGEVIIAEHIHRTPAQAMGSGYCWNISAGSNRLNNWPDMSYLQLVGDYHSRGIQRVSALPMYDISADPDHWALATGPGDLPANKHGWVRLPQYSSINSRKIIPSYPLFRSSFSGSIIDLHRGGGVWQSGSLTGQAVRLIFLPTLNNHGNNTEDYAGITSAVKCHIGFQEGISLHEVGYDYGRPDAVGDCVGHLITQVFEPTFYLTCAEYSGHISRTSSTATQTKTVGLCTDPVSLDYWMSKHVLFPCNNASYFNPDNNNNTRKTLLGCQAKGVGTVDPEQIDLSLIDLAEISLKVTSPDGGEQWQRGEQRAITWNATGINGNLVIELVRDNSVLGVIASGVPVSAGSFTWTVGRLENGSFVTGSNLKIRIRSEDGQSMAEMKIR